MGEKNGAQEGIEGVVEGVKGKVKEAAGAVSGRDDLPARARHNRIRLTRNVRPQRRKRRQKAHALPPMQTKNAKRPNSKPWRLLRGGGPPD